MRSRFVVREIPILVRSAGRLKDVRKVIIGFHDGESGVVYPHPVTSFIETQYFNQSLSLSHQLQPAHTVVQFLNYVRERVDLADGDFMGIQEKGLCGLTINHGSLFLTHLSEDKIISRDWFKKKTGYLTKFYHFLHTNGLLEVDPNINYNKEEKRLNSPFIHVKRPLSNEERRFKKKKDIITSSNNNRMQLVREFLMTAYMTEPSISLGIAFLFLAGLRAGECMNLMRSSVKLQGGKMFGENGIILEVRDNQDKLFQHLTNTATMGVKKPRDQAVLNDPIVSWLYKKHQQWLDKADSQGIIKDHRALFIGSEGLALSGASFRDKFENVKSKFLENLKQTEGRFQDYLDLKQTYWSTHIGRGTFTNLIISSGFTVEQTAIARGDSNINSALHYTDVMSTMNNINVALDTLGTNEASTLIMSPVNKTWKEVFHFGKI